MKAFNLFIFCCFSCHLVAQERASLSGISFDIGTIYTVKNEMTPVPQSINGVEVYSKGLLGYTASLSGLISVSDNTSLGASLMGGTYPINIKYDLKKEYTGRTKDFTTRSRSMDLVGYVGIKAGANRFFTIKQHLFSVGANLGVFLFDSFWTQKPHFTMPLKEYDPTLLVFQRTLNSNEDGSYIIAPEVSLNYYKKLRQRFWLYCYMMGTYSWEKPLKGTYEVFGEHETLVGDFSKRYAHIGLGAGILFSNKAKSKK